MGFECFRLASSPAGAEQSRRGLPGRPSFSTNTSSESPHISATKQSFSASLLAHARGSGFPDADCVPDAVAGERNNGFNSQSVPVELRPVREASVQARARLALRRPCTRSSTPSIYRVSFWGRLSTPTAASCESSATGVLAVPLSKLPPFSCSNSLFCSGSLSSARDDRGLEARR